MARAQVGSSAVDLYNHMSLTKHMCYQSKQLLVLGQETFMAKVLVATAQVGGSAANL